MATKWTSENTNHLLSAMKGYRPIGVEKHFHMMFILEKFRTKSGLNTTSEALWDQINKFYDINLLSDRENEEFRKKPVEFSLPADFKS